MDAPRTNGAAGAPPLVLRVLFGLALAMGLFPAAYAVRYTRSVLRG